MKGERKKFYLQRYTKNESGVYIEDGERKSLEDDFGFIRYKSMSGINSRGKQKSLYVETYSDNESARVYFDANARREQTALTLSLCVFGSAPEGSTDIEITERITAAEYSWNGFCDWLENHFILWYDEYRQRKALVYLSDEITPKSDVIKNTPYLQCEVKFTNVFGKTFSADDSTIEKWLESGGKEY